MRRILFLRTFQRGANTILGSGLVYQEALTTGFTGRMVADLVIRNGVLGSQITMEDENTASTYGKMANGTICLVSTNGNRASFVKQVSNFKNVYIHKCT